MPAQADNGVSPKHAGARVIALMNQKGGVGKTTTTVNLAAAIAERGRPTLVVDLDPQSHAGLHLGFDPAGGGGALDQAGSGPRSIYDLLLDPTLDPAPAIRRVRPNLSLLPAETDLAGLETELSDQAPAERTTRLRRVIDRLAETFRFILIDCPPSLGVLTLNGLTAAREVFIPMQAHFLALQGVGKLLETVQLVGKTSNPGLTVSGVILCMHDPSSTHSREVVNDLAGFFAKARAAGQDTPWRHARVLDPPIRRNIKLAECPSFGQTIFDYAPWCPGALDYRALADSVIGEPAPAPPAPPPPVAAPAVTVPPRRGGAKPAHKAGA